MSGRSGRREPAKGAKRSRGAGPARKGTKGAATSEAPPRRFRSGRFVRVMLIGATVALAAVLGASSVRTWANQRNQLEGARREASELDTRIASLEAEIATRTTDEGARIEALCFGPYVEPGVEVYSIPGVDGCVSGN